MEIAEYFDSVAAFWDDDFSEAKPARVVASTISIPRGGACVLDIGCGSGSMFMDLLESGACEIVGLDISGGMVEAAKEKFCFAPRIHVEKGDFLTHEQLGYDVLMGVGARIEVWDPDTFDSDGLGEDINEIAEEMLGNGFII